MYYYYDPNERVNDWGGSTLYMVAVSEKILPRRTKGKCPVYDEDGVPRLSLGMKIGTKISSLAIGDPRILKEEIEYLGRRLELFPEFIKQYIEEHKESISGKVWMAFKYSDGKLLFVNWDFVALAKHVI